MRKNIYLGGTIPDFTLSPHQELSLSGFLDNEWGEFSDDLQKILVRTASNYAIFENTPKSPFNNTEIRKELNKIKDNLATASKYLDSIPQEIEEWLDHAFWETKKDPVLVDKCRDIPRKDFLVKYVSGFGYMLDGMIETVDNVANKTPVNGAKRNQNLTACIAEMIRDIKAISPRTETLTFSSSKRGVFRNIVDFLVHEMLDHEIQNTKSLIERAKARAQEKQNGKA